MTQNQFAVCHNCINQHQWPAGCKDCTVEVNQKAAALTPEQDIREFTQKRFADLDEGWQEMIYEAGLLIYQKAKLDTARNIKLERPQRPCSPLKPF